MSGRMVKGWARLGWSGGGGRTVGSGEGGNLKYDIGNVVALTAGAEAFKPSHCTICEADMGRAREARW